MNQEIFIETSWFPKTVTEKYVPVFFPFTSQPINTKASIGVKAKQSIGNHSGWDNAWIVIFQISNDIQGDSGIWHCKPMYGKSDISRGCKVESSCKLLKKNKKETDIYQNLRIINGHFSRTGYLDWGKTHKSHSSKSLTFDTPLHCYPVTINCQVWLHLGWI